MMPLEEILLSEATTAPPCGLEMTYSPEFMALEQAARGKQEQQYGETIIPAEDPDWRAVERSAAALLQSSKDVRIAGYLCHAWVHSQGMAGLASGAHLMGELLHRYWDAVHPLPEDGDYFMRMNAVAMLNDVAGLMRDLRQTELLRCSLGTVTVRDAELAARGQKTEASVQLTPEQLRANVADALQRQDAAVAAIAPAHTAVQRLVQICGDRLPSHQQPDLGQIQALLRLFQDLLPTDQKDSAAAADAIEPAATTAGFSQPSDIGWSPAGQASIRSRQDAQEQLVRIAEFLETTEPTNPASLLIRRAARLMGMGFIDVLRELAPNSLEQIELITGATATDR